MASTHDEAQRAELLALAREELEAARAELRAAEARIDHHRRANGRWSESRARFVPVGTSAGYTFPEPAPSAVTGADWPSKLELEARLIETYDRFAVPLLDGLRAAQARVDQARAAVAKWSACS